MNNYRSLAYRRYKSEIRVDYESLVTAYQRRLRGRLEISPVWACLDVACGYGNFLAYLRSVGVKDFLGIDTSVAATQVAENEFGNDHVLCADIFQYLGHTSTQFELISALDFIEHLTKEEVFRFVELTGKVQEQGGLLLIRTPNANGLFGMAARYADITHEVCFTIGSITDVLSTCGYRVVHIWEDVGAPVTLLQGVHWLVWQVARWTIRCVNAAEIGSWGDGVLTRNMWVLAQKPLDACTPIR